LGKADTDCGWEPADNTTPEQTFEWRWAVAMLDNVMNRLCADYSGQGKAELFAELKPCLLGDRAAQPYAALAAKLGMTEQLQRPVVGADFPGATDWPELRLGLESVGGLVEPAKRRAAIRPGDDSLVEGAGQAGPTDRQPGNQ
jgi:hypothetical protein